MGAALKWAALLALGFLALGGLGGGVKGKAPNPQRIPPPPRPPQQGGGQQGGGQPAEPQGPSQGFLDWQLDVDGGPSSELGTTATLDIGPIDPQANGTLDIELGLYIEIPNTSVAASNLRGKRACRARVWSLDFQNGRLARVTFGPDLGTGCVLTIDDVTRINVEFGMTGERLELRIGAPVGAFFGTYNPNNTTFTRPEVVQNLITGRDFQFAPYDLDVTARWSWK